MYSRMLVVGAVTLSVVCLSPGAGAQSSRTPPTAPAVTPADPLARVPSGRVLTERTDRGFKILSNVPGNRYTLDLLGKNVNRLGPKNGVAPDLQMWDVDGLILQVIALPLHEKADPSRPMSLLVSHMKYESDFQKGKGWNEVERARAWLSFPTGEKVLYWEMTPPKKDAPPAPTNVTRMIAATTLNGRNILMLAASLPAALDEAKSRRTLTDTLLTLERHEKSVAAVEEMEEPGDGNGFVTLLNDDLATRNDKKAPGAVVLGPEKLIQVLRMAIELEGRVVYITFLYDGVAGHTINMYGYNRQTKEFVYSDTLGQHTFLEEANNHAGVKARRWKESKVRLFLVTESDFQKVLQGVMADYRGVRHYFKSGGLGEAVQEYRWLKEKHPESREWTEAWLLKAGQLLMEIDENARANNIYGACVAVHENSSRALAGIAAVFAKTGRKEPAADFYGSALKKLPEDPSLDAAQRKQLAGEWEAARRALPAKPGK